MADTTHDEDDDSESDAAIVRRSLGEPEAFALIFDRHAARIERYLSRRIGPQVAEDLVAETFLTAFRARGRYRADATDAAPWLHGIATNLLARHRRAEARRYRALTTLPAENPDAGYADEAASDVDAANLRGPLLASLTGLAVRDRDVLLLVAWGDLTYAEVATALDIPIGTVRSRLSRARRRIRANLGFPALMTFFEEVPSHG